MGKIVKYCSKCEEGFAEKFAFCPDCGAPLQAFELNPLTNEIINEPKSTDTVPEPPAFISEPVQEQVLESPAGFENEFNRETEELSLDDADIDAEYDDSAFAAPDNVTEEIKIEEPVAASAAVSSWEQAAKPSYSQPRAEYYEPDNNYYVTVIEEKNVRQRNMLLLGASTFMIVFVLSATVYSLFTKTLGVGAIDEGTSLAYLLEQVPMELEEDQVKKDKDDGGGGGGGGREDKDPVNQGDLADQSKNPTRPPDAKVPRFNFELQTPPPQTEGDRKFEKKYNQWGDPNSRFSGLSNGPGTGGGMGTGTGTGQGSGTGTGTGSGTGSGSGSGDGDGNGSGTGPGDGAPPPATVRVSTPVKILYKPKATYTDPARTNNVQGSVTLKITFLASGQVGSITPVTRLPYGLTEQAIAAARLIKFEPAKVNGVPVSKVMTFQYGFNIY